MFRTQKMRHRIATPAATAPTLTQARNRGAAALAALRGESATMTARRLPSNLLGGRRASAQQRRWPKAALVVASVGGVAAAAGAALGGRSKDEWEPLPVTEPPVTEPPVTEPSATDRRPNGAS